MDIKRRTASQMSVDAHVPSRAAQTLPFPVRYMLLRLGVAVLLRHTKVDDVDHCHRIAHQDQRDSNAAKPRPHAPFAFFVPGRPIRKLSGLMSR